MRAIVRKRVNLVEWGVWFLAFLAVLVVAPKVFGAEVAAATHPKLVTVFPNGARVTREGELQLPEGVSKVIFADLPASINEASLHLDVEGPKGTKLYGVSMRREYTPHVVEGRSRKLKARIQALEDQKTDLTDKVATRRTEIELMKSMVDARTHHEKNPPKSVDEITQSADTIAKKIALLTAANRKDERKVRDLELKISALQNDLSQGGSAAREKRAAEADLELATEGTTRFTLTYQITGATWTPSYDVRLNTEGDKPQLDLGFNAGIRQSTGEDWKNVTLTLSTARSTDSTQVPDPTNWWLDFFNTQVQRYQREQAPYPGAAPRAAMDSGAAAKYLAGKDADLEPAQVEMAKTIETTYSMKFVIPVPHDIPSDGSDHRVGIVQDSHPVELNLVTVPKFSQAVFLEAKITYNGEQLLVPGPAQLFRDGDYVGTANLQSKAQGETFDLGFGQDDQIRVERKIVEDKANKGGIFTTTGERTYQWITTVANYHTGDRTLVVREQLPRTKQKDITVEATELSPKPEAEDPDKPGLISWKLDLKPKEKTKITFGYKVKFPKGVQVYGLE